MEVAESPPTSILPLSYTVKSECLVAVVFPATSKIRPNNARPRAITVSIASGVVVGPIPNAWLTVEVAEPLTVRVPVAVILATFIKLPDKKALP